MADKNRRKIDDIIERDAVITKKSYLFDIRKPYTNIRKFRPSFDGDLSITNIQLIFKDFMDRRKKGGEDKPRHIRPFFNPRVIVMSIVKYTLLFFVLAIIGIMVLSWLSQPEEGGKAAPTNYTFNFTYEFMNTEVISYGSNIRAYATIRLNGSDTKSANILMRLFEGQLPEEVYLLKSRRYEADDFATFQGRLKDLLQGSGVRMNEIRIDQLVHMPKSDPIVLIVPTGKVPRAFLGLDNPDFSFRKLMNDNDVIIYIGYGFGSEAIGEDGKLDPVSKQTLSKLGISFEDLPSDTRLSDGFKMDRASYRIAGAMIAHNGISVISGFEKGTEKPRGYLVVFPATMNNGWANKVDAAYDVYSVIREITWLKPSSFADVYTITNTDREKQVNETSTIFSNPYSKRENLTAQFTINVTGFSGENHTRLEYVKFPIVARGTLSHPDSAIQTNICMKKDVDGSVRGCELYMTMDLKETAQRTEMMRISAYKNGERVSDTSIGQKSVQLTGEKLSYNVELDPGDYVLKIEDDTGYVYAQSFLHVHDITFKILPKGDYSDGIVFVEGLSDGATLPPGFDLRNIRISLDGQQNRTLSSSRSGSTTYIKYDFAGGIPEGDHKLSVSYGEKTDTLAFNYTRQREWWDNPIYQVMLLLAVIIGAVAMMIKRPESVIFQLDVPDFPPLSKTKVPITREQACQIFELVNADYRWRNMPLRQGEIKNGFRKISYRGRSVLVSDYNLERILDQLVSEGLVKSSMQFYGLSSWEEKSGKTIEYLAVFRSLRDVFLNMSIHFSDLGDRADCDIMVTAHDRYFVHIHQGFESVGRALLTVSKGRTILVFKDRDAVDEFKRNLTSTNEAMIKVKMYVDNENLYLGTPDDVERIVKR